MAQADILRLYVPKIWNGSRRGMAAVRDLVYQNVIARTPKWTGKLRHSITKKPHPSGIAWTIAAPPNSPKAFVMEGNPAAKWRRIPSSSKLVPWVAERLGLSDSPGRIKRGKRRGRFKKSPAAIVAFLIARRIKKNGIQIPLKHSGLGAMFRRTREHIIAMQHVVARQFAVGYKAGKF